MSGQDRPDNLVEMVVEQQRAATINVLRASRQDTAVLALVRQVHDDMTATIEALPSKAQHACAARL